MNKKAQSGIAGRKVIFYILNSVLLAVIFLILTGMLLKMRAVRAEIPEGLENFVFTQRFISSPYCFTYQDHETSRYYRGIIDWSKFSQDNLNSCYSVVKSGKAFNLKITNLFTEESKEINTKNWVGKINEERDHNIKIYKNGKFYDGKLTVRIQNAK